VNEPEESLFEAYERFEEYAREALDALPPDLRSLHEIAHHFGISDERLIEIDRY
jgi:predicted Zn-dependent protease with MMP-like domain